MELGLGRSSRGSQMQARLPGSRRESDTFLPTGSNWLASGIAAIEAAAQYSTAAQILLLLITTTATRVSSARVSTSSSIKYY